MVEWSLHNTVMQEIGNSVARTIGIQPRHGLAPRTYGESMAHNSIYRPADLHHEWFWGLVADQIEEEFGTIDFDKRII